MDQCDFTNPAYHAMPGCLSGLRLALRYSDELLLQRSEWDEYYRIMAAVYAAEPLTQLATPSGSEMLLDASLYTTYPPIVDAWSQGRVHTGDTAVDAIFVDAVERVEDGGLAGPTGPTHIFRVFFVRPASGEVLRRRLEPIPDTTGPELQQVTNDTRVSWAGDLAQLVLIGGWGDCASGCAWFHFWSATVDRSNAVQVWDLGGDPIPAWIVEALTSPPPP